MPEGDGDIVNDFGVGGDILTEISAIPPGDGRDQFSVFIAQCHGETVNFGLDQKGDPLP